MRVLAFVGPSGTGKSYRAQLVARENNIHYIIDDGLLINENEVLAGTSAKKAPTKIETVKHALFIEEKEQADMKKAFKKYKPDSLLILGIFVPFKVIMIPITVMMSRLGLTNIWGLIILYLTYAVPQTLFLYVGYIKLSVPDSLDEAAEIDGADKFITYRKIVFPMLKPMHATTLIINALWFWNDFMLPLLMLNKSSDSWSLPLFQYNYTGQYLSDYGPSFASYVVGIITITIVYLIFQKHIISGMSNGAVK